MPNAGRITPKQIELARKILSIVPPKDNTCSREEAGEVLAKDFKLAFKKGYSPREIAAMLKVYGIIIPSSVVAKYDGPETEKELDVSRLLEASGKCSRKKARPVATRSLLDDAQVRSAVIEQESMEQFEDAAPASRDQALIAEENLCGQTNSNVPANEISDGQATCGMPELQHGHREEKGIAGEKIESSDRVNAVAPDTENGSAPANSVPAGQKDQTPSNKNGTEKAEKTQPQAEVIQPQEKKNPWDIDLADWCGPAKINPANYGTFKIKPDTPKGEL